MSETKSVRGATVFKLKLDELADLALELNGTKINYTDEEFANAAHVFMEPFMSRMHDFHNDKLSRDGMLALCEEAGKSLRQTILLFTGLDMHNVYKK